MINIKIKKIENKIYEFNIEGHSGYSESGTDIICAATSMITINTINSIDKFTNDELIITAFDEPKGIIGFKLDKEYSNETDILLKSLEFGLNSVKEQYGSEYIEIKEVQ